MTKKSQKSKTNSKKRQNAKSNLSLFAVDKPNNKKVKQSNKMLFAWPVFFATILIFAGLALGMVFVHKLIIDNTPIILAYSPPVTEFDSSNEEIITKQVGLKKSIPTNVSIKRLGIDYPVISVGRLSDGTMETPPFLDWVTGWYQYSPTPGEVGPAIIVGHVGNKNGPSVFWDLNKTIRGDIIDVKRKDGKVAKFKVEDVRQFDQDNFPTEEVYGPINYPGLRLITCGGVYDKNIERYSHNTVVYAKLIQDN